MYVGNDVYIWEMVKVFEKRLKYVLDDVHLWEMSEICGEMESILETALLCWK